MEHLLDLDDPTTLDPARAGAKAARLALARRHGLPTLPGVVVPAGVSEPALSAGTRAFEAHGSGRARLVVLDAELDPELRDALENAGRELGPPLIVRSSTDVERDGRWAGAFGSLAGVLPNELPKAVRSCWASVFRPDPSDRLQAAGELSSDLRFAVLVQPQLEPDSAGTAHVREDRVVAIAGTQGSPAALMAGWDPGVQAQVDRDANVHGTEAVATLGRPVLQQVAELARTTASRLGDHTIEWAMTSSGIRLLQTQPGNATPPPSRTGVPGVPPALRDRRALALARLVLDFHGPLAQELVLPWAVAVPERVHPPDRNDLRGHGLSELRRHAGELAASAWGLPPSEAMRLASRTLRELRGPDPADAIERIDALNPVSTQGTEDLLAAALDEVRPRKAADRRGPNRWEPFVHAVIESHGPRTAGVAAAVGIGAGRVAVVPSPHAPPPLSDRQVLVCPRPVPGLAPLLWRASAVVTVGGSPGAHLFEVARSLGVPAVITPHLSYLLDDGVPPGTLAAVDGTAGAVTTITTTADRPMTDTAIRGAT